MDERIRKARNDPTRAIQEQIRAGTKLPRNTAELLCAIGYEPIVLLMGGPSRPGGDHHCYRVPQLWTYKHNKIRKAEWWTNLELAYLYASMEVENDYIYARVPPRFQHKTDQKLNNSIPQKPNRMVLHAGEWVFRENEEIKTRHKRTGPWRRAWTRDFTISDEDQFFAVALSRCNLIIIYEPILDRQGLPSARMVRPTKSHTYVVHDAIMKLGTRLLGTEFDLKDREIRAVCSRNPVNVYGEVEPEFKIQVDRLHPFAVEMILMIGFQYMGTRATLDYLAGCILNNLGFKV